MVSQKITHSSHLKGVTPRRRVVWNAPEAATVKKAAELCWGSGLWDYQVAAQLGITRRTLTRWRRRPEFIAEQERLLAAWRREVAQNLRQRTQGR